MPQNPFFSLTPKNPHVYTYDAANANAPHAQGSLQIFGGVFLSKGPFGLSDQCESGEIRLGHDPVAPGDGTITSLSDDFGRRCTIFARFKGVNVATNNQYLLLVQLNGYGPGVSAQLFVGTELVREEAINGEEQVAVLMDVPGDGGWVVFFIRLASESWNASMGFTGLDCYLL